MLQTDHNRPFATIGVRYCHPNKGNPQRIHRESLVIPEHDAHRIGKIR